MCIRDSYDRFKQNELMNAAVNSLVEAGYQIIVPFDSDEFWDIDVKDVVRRYSAKQEKTFFGRWTNFVQSVELRNARAFGLFHIRYRAIAMSDANQEKVTSFRRPFVCHSDVKAAFKTSKPVELQLGQHALGRRPKKSKRTFEIFHVPIRYRSEIEKRGMNYEPRRAVMRTNPSQSWQSAFHREVVVRNAIDEVWKANSACRDGYIDAYGDRFPLVPDLRLRRLLMKASIYLAWNFRLLAV